MQPNDPNAGQPIPLVPLAGSERPPLPDVASPRAANPDATADVTVVLRRRQVPGSAPLVGADPDDLQRVVDTLQGLGLTVLLADEPSRRVRVRGTVTQLGRVFGTQLAEVQSAPVAGAPPVTHRYRTGGLSVPAALDGVITAVLGLDDRPQARAQFRTAHPSAAGSSFTAVEIAQIYRFPANTDGTGQTVAIIELGGGFGQRDLDTYFQGLGLKTPSITAQGVDGAENKPGQDPQGADGEVLLDIQVVGAAAPGAAQVVYFAPNTDAGFLDAVSEAVHATPRPVAISISWGQSEDQWTAQGRNAMDGVFADAVQLGITVTAASGDNGSADRATDGKDHADFPASSPHVLGCGGTTLQAQPGGAITSETVWNDGGQGGATGGGVSDAFDRPAYQQDVGVPGAKGRGVPDVAGNADPQTGYKVVIDGQAGVIGGTSAVSPLWAALAARLQQAFGSTPLPPLGPALYAGAKAGSPTPGFHDVTQGNNGTYSAGAGWDACTGLGTPDGEALLAVLRGAAGGTAG